jgi:hypothetical protein
VLKEKHAEGAFHDAGYTVARILSGPPLVRQPSAYPAKTGCQFLECFPAHAPILARILDSLNP